MRSIPISVQEELVSKSDDHRYDVILDTATKEWLLSSDSGSWYIVNLKRFGYFVPSYDDNNWSALIIFLRNLNISKVDAVDRALILENALFAAESGTLSYQNFFELLGYITRETDYFPIDIFIRVTNRVKAQLAQSVLQPQFLVLFSICCDFFDSFFRLISVMSVIICLILLELLSVILIHSLSDSIGARSCSGCVSLITRCVSSR